MRFALERMIAWRYLRSRKEGRYMSLISVISFLAIALGVGTLIVVMSVMNGFRHELFSHAMQFNGDFSVVPRPTAVVVPPLEEVQSRLKSAKVAAQFFPLIESFGLVTAHGQAMGVMVRGMTGEDLTQKPIIADHLLVGSLEPLMGEEVVDPTNIDGPPIFNDHIVIGVRLAEQLGVTAGDEVSLMAPSVSATAFGAMPRVKNFKVAAVYDSGWYQYDIGFIFMPLASAEVFFKQGPGKLEAFAKGVKMERAVAQTEVALDGMPLLVNTWMHNSALAQAAAVESNVMRLILFLIVLVASFNIVSSLIMLVQDKARAIAILRTMGATRGSILRIFFMTGASVGIAGTLGGVTLGLGFALNIESIRRVIEKFGSGDLFSPEVYFLSKLPAIVDFEEVAWVTSISLLITFLATLYPAWRAARLDPVEALRYE